MNNYVQFEPTELGEKVYKDYFTQLGFEEPHNKLEIVDGKAKLQFHNFIHIYGDYITSYICKDKEVFKHYEFYIDEPTELGEKVYKDYFTQLRFEV